VKRHEQGTPLQIILNFADNDSHSARRIDPELSECANASRPKGGGLPRVEVNFLIHPYQRWTEPESMKILLNDLRATSPSGLA